MESNLDRMVREAGLKSVFFLRCADHNTIVMAHETQTPCDKCMENQRSGRETSTAVKCWFVHKPGETTGAYSEHSKELKQMLLNYGIAKRVRPLDFVQFAGVRGFRIKHVPRD